VNLTEKFILLAEDDMVVAELVLHTLRAINPTRKVVHVRDGVEALECLQSRQNFPDCPAGHPAVVLLDLKMPRLDGFEVLRHMRADENLKGVPVVVLTSSQDEGDIRESYQLGANAYIVKPVEFRKFAFVLEQVENFWLVINHPPPLVRVAATAGESR